jgi:tetratricopeptide (TPR) repeat protein
MQERTIRQVYDSTSANDPRAVLGVGPDAGHEAIERAYEEAKAMFGEDRVLPTVRARFKTELAVIESRLIEAYLKLSRPGVQDRSTPHEPEAAKEEEAEGAGVGDLLVRVEMDKAKSKIEHEKVARVADGYFQQARKALREADFHNAIQYAKLAISYNDREAGYFFLLAECQVRNPGARWQHLAEQNFTTAAELDPWNADYRVRLGMFYKKRGLHTRARKQFEEALRLSPNHEQATRELNSL